jgi:uncharacterized tellurite resistance protein B-like protein
MPIRRLLSLFGLDDQPANENPFTSALADSLDQIPAERLEYLAGFAGQLIRVAYADDEISAAEMQVIRELLVTHAELHEDETQIVVDLLEMKLRELRGCEEYRLNRAINDNADLTEKERLVQFLFAVASADGLVSNVEDQEIRRIGDALQIPKERFMDIRTRYRDKLEVLRAAAAARAKTNPAGDE